MKQLSSHIQELQERHRKLKPEIDKITKDLAALGFKPGDPLEMTKMPITDELIEKATAALKDGGKNAKSLQKAMGIFDYAELGRIRKALTASGITVETENYHGTNATWIELNPEFVSATHDEQAEGTDDEASDSGAAGSETEPPPAKPTTVKPTPKK